MNRVASRIRDRLEAWLQISDVPSLWGVGILGGILLGYGMFWHHAGLLALGAVVLFFVFRAREQEKKKSAARKEAQQETAQRVREHKQGHPTRQEQHNATEQDEHASWNAAELPIASNTEGLVEQLLGQNRYALLLRPETSAHLTRHQLKRALREFDEAMSLVPGGRVLTGAMAEPDVRINSDFQHYQTGEPAIVEPIYLDRFAVTNQQYQSFLDDGGYENLEYWPEESFAALLGFIDQTDVPGPRYWENGHYLPGTGRLPVVGISWFEAVAFAHWAGKRLPTDAEWTKAGAWPVESTPGRVAQRRYPWGESFDPRRANLWTSRKNETVPVDDYPQGTSVGGVAQLIGNVWEWTSTSLADLDDKTLHAPDSMRCIRGGAFDTYFESHATCHFQSGESPLARRRNIGMRLAISMSSLESFVNEPTDEDAMSDLEPLATD